MTETSLSPATADDYLGPAAGRFLGSGYRRTSHTVTDLVVTPAGDDAGVTANVTVGYPSDWSTKKGVELRPHLSSVDALVLGVQLGEAHLTHGLGLSPAGRRAAWLRTIDLKAGRAPQEELTGLAGTARVRARQPAQDGMDVTAYDAMIGSMRARCEFVHASVAADRGIGRYPELPDLLGPAPTRYYGTGFTADRHRVEDINVDLAGLRATANARIEPADTEPTNHAPVPAIEGVEGDYQPSAGMIDCFVIGFQLVQVLMYQLDELTRADSNTLWMLHTTLTASGPPQPCRGPLPVEAAITEKRLVRLHGGIWRSMRVRASCGAVTMRASCAHELPARVAAAAAERQEIR